MALYIYLKIFFNKEHVIFEIRKYYDVTDACIVNKKLNYPFNYFE